MAETTALTKRSEMDNATLTAVVTDGDCSRLNEQQRREYYLARCEAAGLDPRTAPFMFTKLNGKLVLYALKGASDQLASNNKVATTILKVETIDGVYCVTVRATAADGRSTEDMGAVQVGSLKGEPLANALMKAVTKAKRRAVLSLCGLGMLDETEVQDITPPVRGVVRDDAPITIEQKQDKIAVAEADRLVERLSHGFRNWDEKRAWADANKDAKAALSPADQARVTAAFKAAHPTKKAAPPVEPPHDEQTGEVREPGSDDEPPMDSERIDPSAP